MIRVMLVDDQEIIRTGLRVMIEAQPDLKVAAEAGDGFTALRLLDEVDVDVVLMDIRMPGIDGVETTRRLRTRHSPQQVRVLVLTTFEQDANVIAALRAGANGFLGKGVGPRELAQAILEVATGGGALSATATAALISHVAAEKPVAVDATAAELFAALTPREMDVVRALVAGKDYAAIAREFVVSPFTVKTHANRAMVKVGVNDRAQLVSLAVRAGITG